MSLAHLTDFSTTTYTLLRGIWAKTRVKNNRDINYLSFISLELGGRFYYHPGNNPSTKFDIVESGTYKWTASGSGTTEFYAELDAGGDPSLAEPDIVLENNVGMPDGTLGSLAAGEFDYGDNDTLGFNTVYVRLTDGADPDSKVDGFLEHVVVKESAEDIYEEEKLYWSDKSGAPIEDLFVVQYFATSGKLKITEAF